jgi:protease II
MMAALAEELDMRALRVCGGIPTQAAMISTSDLPPAPRANRIPHQTTVHGTTLDDPYHWLKDPGYPEVKDEAILSYLREENAYFEAAMAPRADLVETIFQEMKGRMKEDDSSVPQKDGDWLYWWAYEAGSQYPHRWRRPVAGGADQMVLDEAAEAEGKAYFRLAAFSVSPDGRLLAWSADENGAERFTLRIRDLATGADIETVSSVTNGGVVWSADSGSIVFTEVNDNWRSYRARRRDRLVRRGGRGLSRRRRPHAGPPVDPDRDRGQSDERDPPRSRCRSLCRADARLAPAGEAAICGG